MERLQVGSGKVDALQTGARHSGWLSAPHSLCNFHDVVV